MKYQFVVSGIDKDGKSIQGKCVAASVSESEKLFLDYGYAIITDVQLCRNGKVFEDTVCSSIM